MESLKAELYSNIDKFNDLGETFFTHFNTIESLTLLDKTKLQNIGVTDEKTRAVICYYVDKFLKMQTLPAGKVVNDAVHGSIYLHPLAVAIIDTPYFQRLRFLKQVGVCSYVYPCATHTRFEHSIGTYHLAGLLLKHLKTSQPELNISESDVLCVQLAGLCHDLGHGPFSHLFDALVVPRFHSQSSDWCHEKGSLMMLDKIYEVKRDEFNKWGLTQEDINSIKQMIWCEQSKQSNDGDRWKTKPYLYDVISNSKSGLDVDKWDYIARDCLYLGVKCRFDHLRLILNMRVIDGEICVRDKEFKTLVDMFSTRYDLHLKAYQHPVTNALELMVSDAMVLAEPVLKMSEMITDPDKYVHLNDGVYHQILYMTDERLEEAKKLLERIDVRSLYKFIGETRPGQGFRTSEGKAEQEILDILVEMTSHPKSYWLDKIKVTLNAMHFGKKGMNPLLKIRSYSKVSLTASCEKTEEQLCNENLYSRFQDKMVRVYSKVTDGEVTDAAYKAFCKWCHQKKLQTPSRI